MGGGPQGEMLYLVNDDMCEVVDVAGVVHQHRLRGRNHFQTVKWIVDPIPVGSVSIMRQKSQEYHIFRIRNALLFNAQIIS